MLFEKNPPKGSYTDALVTRWNQIQSANLWKVLDALALSKRRYELIDRLTLVAALVVVFGGIGTLHFILPNPFIAEGSRALEIALANMACVFAGFSILGLSHWIVTRKKAADKVAADASDYVLMMEKFIRLCTGFDLDSPSKKTFGDTVSLAVTLLGKVRDHDRDYHCGEHVFRETFLICKGLDLVQGTPDGFLSRLEKK